MNVFSPIRSQQSITARRLKANSKKIGGTHYAFNRKRRKKSTKTGAR